MEEEGERGHLQHEGVLCTVTVAELRPAAAAPAASAAAVETRAAHARQPRPAKSASFLAELRPPFLPPWPTDCS